jgi:heparan-alpha-glucosaminide N-acetyltransferase
LWLHVVVRTVSLVVLGLILANAEKANAVRMGMSSSAWALIALIGAALFLNVYDKSPRFSMLYRWIRIIGLLLVATMFALFRAIPGTGHASWIDFHYPEILGYIGCTYLAVAILYIPTRRWLWAPLGWFVAMITLNALTVAKWITVTRGLRYYIWPFGNGSLCGITLAGILTSVIFLGAHRWQTVRQKTLLALAFGIAALVAGRILTPLGISKVRATPTWSLYSIAAAVLLFTALYWICDVKKQTAWAFFVRPAGANTLTTYLLPDFWYYILTAAGIGFFESHFNAGWQGVVWCGAFTALILALSALLTRWKIRLQL